MCKTSTQCMGKMLLSVDNEQNTEDSCTKRPIYSVPAWDRLLHFSAHCLRAPTRGGRRWNLARAINDQIRTESDPVPSPSPENPHGRRKHRKVRDPLESLAALVASKLEEGDFKGAVRLACSEDSVAGMNDSTLDALRRKHPPPHPDSQMPSPPWRAQLLSHYFRRSSHPSHPLIPKGVCRGPRWLTAATSQRYDRSLCREWWSSATVSTYLPS